MTFQKHLQQQFIYIYIYIIYELYVGKWDTGMPLFQVTTNPFANFHYFFLLLRKHNTCEKLIDISKNNKISKIMLHVDLLIHQNEAESFILPTSTQNTVYSRTSVANAELNTNVLDVAYLFLFSPYQFQEVPVSLRF